MPDLPQTNAYVLRISPDGEDRLADGLATDQIFIGWGGAQGLTDLSLDWLPFREIISATYYPTAPTKRRAGGTAGQLWRFIRDMKQGDLIVVPHPGAFYVAEVAGLATQTTDTSVYSRPVRWLNDKNPIPRRFARSALQSRMKVQNTCADASDLVDDIRECLRLARMDLEPNFHRDLHTGLIGQAIATIRTGRVDSYGFEDLIRDTMLGMGAKSCTITPRKIDYGADLVATFLLADVFEVRIAIQAKHHYDPQRPTEASVIGEVIRGIEREAATLGMVISAGTVSKSAYDEAAKYFDTTGIKIEILDGEQFAALIVERGLSAYAPKR